MRLDVDPIAEGYVCEACGGPLRYSTKVVWDPGAREYAAIRSPVVAILARDPEGRIVKDARGEPVVERAYDCYCKECNQLYESAMLRRKR